MLTRNNITYIKKKKQKGKNKPSSKIRVLYGHTEERETSYNTKRLEIPHIQGSWHHHRCSTLTAITSSAHRLPHCNSSSRDAEAPPRGGQKTRLPGKPKVGNSGEEDEEDSEWMWPTNERIIIHSGLRFRKKFLRLLPNGQNLRAALDEGLRSKAQWNREILLDEGHKLDPRAIDQGPRPKSGKSRLNLNGTILEGNSISKNESQFLLKCLQE
jgi:hypothetical protein